MAEARQLSCGMSGSCKSAKLGLGFPASEASGRTPRPYLPPELVRLIDAFVRAMEREAILRAMNAGNLCRTLRDAAGAGGLLDVRFLLAAGVDAGADDGEVLYFACRGGHLQVAEALLDAGGALTPLHRTDALWNSAMYGYTACCELLLDRGADIHHDGEDVLRVAAFYGHLETVTFLLDRGADAWSEKALMWANTRHYDAIVALLLARRGGGGAAQ